MKLIKKLKVPIYSLIRDNKFNLVKERKNVIIERGFFYFENEDVKYILKKRYIRVEHLSPDKYTYWLDGFKDVDLQDNVRTGWHISLSWWENQKFLWLTRDHPILNIFTRDLIFLLIGSALTLLCDLLSK